MPRPDHGAKSVLCAVASHPEVMLYLFAARVHSFSHTSAGFVSLENVGPTSYAAAGRVSFAGAPGAGRCLAIGIVSCTSVHPPIAASSSTGASRTTCLDSRVANLKAVMHQQNGRRALKQLDSQDVAGAHEDRAPRGRPKSSRGGQSSRARRLQKFQEASAVCAQDMMLLHRANLREAMLATCAHSECSRETARQLLACRRHTR